LSVAVAKALDTYIISADSRQFYKEMSIGTAKPTTEEMGNVEHFFIHSHSVTEELTAAEFAKEARSIIDQRPEEIIVITGGSGMFIDALCIGLDDLPTDKTIKTSLIDQFEQEGLEKLVDELKELDPVYAETADLRNPARVIRALEVIRASRKKYSELRTERKESPYNLHRFVIDHPRHILYERINDRVDQMIEAGLIEEVRGLEEFKDLTSLNTVGYKELFAFFSGDLSKGAAIEKIKQNTRRYAKRQLTWFKRHDHTHWLSATDIEKMRDEVIKIVGQGKVE
jgi:tRNA dimethylallyltransferase